MSDLKASALLEEVTRLHSEKADLRVQLHMQIERNNELQQRVNELESRETVQEEE